MKILFITDGFYPFVLGGMQKHNFNVINQLASLNNQITVLYTASMKPANEQIENTFSIEVLKNVQFIYVENIFTKNFPGHYLVESAHFSKLCFKAIEPISKSFDIIYSKGFTAWHLLKNKSKIHIPIVVQLHGFEMYQKAFTIKQKFEQYLLRIPTKFIISNADAILSYGGKIKSLLIKLGVEDKKIFNQYGAVDEFWLNPMPNFVSQNPVAFLFVARFEKRKGYEMLKNVLQSEIINQDIVFHIVGNIPESEKIIHQKIIYYGNLNMHELKEVKSKMDCLLVPSLAEGFPTIIIEAMARGLVCIATDVGAVAQVVNNENGILIEAGSAQELSIAISKILNLNKQHLIKLKQEAYSTVKNKFNWNNAAQDLILQFQKIIHDYRERPNRK